MMTREVLRKLVDAGEGLQTEFKLKVTHPEKILKGVSAFANTKGGYILLGVDDTGKIIGLQESDQDAYLLQSYIERRMKPIPQYAIHFIPVSKTRQVVAFLIKAGIEKPFYVLPDATQEGGHPKAYIRLADQSIQASREVREWMKLKRKDRNLKFQFGEKEKKLMEHLAESGQIDVSTLAKVAQIPKSVASRTLVLLTVCKVLHLTPKEGGGDLFTLAEPSADVAASR